MADLSSSVLSQAKAVYTREWCARSFEEDLCLHLEHGFVFSTPRSFIMGRPVRRCWDEEDILNPEVDCYPESLLDTWLVWLYAGPLELSLRYVPFELPWVAFQRNNVLKYYNFKRLYAKVASSHIQRDPLLQGLTKGSEATTAAYTSHGC